MLLLVGCGSSTPELPEARSYQVISKGDSSFPGRKRVQFNIVSSEADTREEFAQTAMRAAIDAIEQENSDVAAVYLEASPGTVGQGTAYAIAFYAPDSGGLSGEQEWKWDVEAQDKPFSTQQIRIAELWDNYRDDYQTPEGYTDEAPLREFIANELGIEAQEVRLPLANRTNYTTEGLMD